MALMAAMIDFFANLGFPDYDTMNDFYDLFGLEGYRRL